MGDKKKPKSIEGLFDGFIDAAFFEEFDNERFCGITLQWQKKGRGFGEYCIAYDKRAGKWTSDAESDRVDSIEWAIKQGARSLAEAIVRLDDAPES